MEDPLKQLLDKFTVNAPAPIGVFEAVERHLGRPLSEQYKNFMRKWNGGEGFIGDRYLVLWRVEELVRFNREYETAEYAPELFFFGSNGGGEGFAFDLRGTTMTIRIVPFIGMCIEDAVLVAEDFDTFLVRLFESDESLF